jgi:chromate reductase, NAD(P)H dehydrogenase (quinone)
MALPFKIAAISGSLRKQSFNTATLRVLRDLQPGRLDIDIITLEDIPLFNEDVEAQGWPERVAAIRNRVDASDAIILATPEYNYSIPGVLKNALDWLSRPTGKGPIVGKPLAIVGASLAKTGTARAQAHLRSVAFYNAMPLLPTAEVLISRAQDIFVDGQLKDEETRKFLEGTLDKFSSWIEKHQR